MITLRENNRLCIARMIRSLTFSGKLWRYSSGKASWYFITLPYKDAEFIRWVQDKWVVGFGFVRVQVQVGGSVWQTSIFPTKEKEYYLAIKKSIRIQENLQEGMEVKGTITLL